MSINKSDASISLTVPDYDTNFRIHSYSSAKGSGAIGIYNKYTGKNSVQLLESTDTLSLSTPLPYSSGGTNANSLSGAKSNLGITALEQKFTLGSSVRNVTFEVFTDGKGVITLETSTNVPFNIKIAWTADQNLYCTKVNK